MALNIHHRRIPVACIDKINQSEFRYRHTYEMAEEFMHYSNVSISFYATVEIGKMI
jgi:hypothetical protein